MDLGEISPPSNTSIDVQSFEESRGRRLSEEQEREAVRDNLAECLTESEARNGDEQQGNARLRVRYLSGRNDEVPQTQRTDRGKVAVKPKQACHEPDKSPVTVRYTFGKKEVDSATAKSKIEAGRLHEDDVGDNNESLLVDGPSYAAVASAPPPPPDDESGLNGSCESSLVDGPSYATVTSAPSPPLGDESGLNGTYETASLTPSCVPKTPNNTEVSTGDDGQNTPLHLLDLDKLHLQPGDIGENIGDRLHQVLKHASERMGNEVALARLQGDVHADAEQAREAPDAAKGGGDREDGRDDIAEAEARELEHSHMAPGDFGTDIGDAAHHFQAHEEAEHRKVQHVLSTRLIAIPTQPPAEFASGPATPRCQPPTSTATSERPKRPGDGVDEGHKCKIPCRSNTNRGMEPDVSIPPLTEAQVFPSASTGATEPSPTDHISHYPPTSQFLESASRRPEAPLPQLPDVSRSQLDSALAPRDTAIWELQNEVSVLKSAVESLQAADRRPSDARDLVRGHNGTETYTKLDHVPDAKRSETELLVEWSIRGCVLLSVAAVAGWIGAVVERGTFGRTVAEWVWRQAGRGAYAG